MNKLLSLDTSSTCSGWCVFIDGVYTQSGVINLKKEKFLDGNSRLEKMCKELLNLLILQMPNVVVIENTFVGKNAQSQNMLTMILGVVYGYCLQNNIYYYSLRASEWRSLVSKEKHVSKRSELKEWSVKKVKELFNINVSDDESDAILLGVGLLNKYTI